VREVRKTVTVLFADVVGSTKLGEGLDAEALRKIMTRYFAEMAEIVEAHGGTVEKFIGDEVMAVFGVPAVHEDDALRAVRAAAAMRDRLQALKDADGAEWWAQHLEIRIGVNTGEVVAGDPSAGHGFVAGNAVNIAKRVEQAADPGEILLGDSTARLVRHAAVTGAAKPVPTKGAAGQTAGYPLESVDITSEALPRRLDAPLVDREDELAALRAEYGAAVRSRSPRLATVLGVPGIGKSRLALELLDEVAAEATVLLGRCIPYGEGITFWPVGEILPGETFEGTSDEIFWRIRRRLEAIGADRPLVVCFEDVHWAEPKLLDLIEYLAGWIQGHVLILCLARPELLEKRPDWQRGEPGAVTVTLGPLSESQSTELLGLLDTPDRVRERIARAAEGNPLFVEQMAAMAAEQGGDDVAVPATIRSLLAARLDRLAAQEAAVLERAAVIGREFPLRAVVGLSPPDAHPHVASHLLGLARKGLVRPQAGGEEDLFRFHHGLVRDAVYEAMPKAVRTELHERHAGWLEGQGRPDFLVGYHLEQAVRTRRELALPDDERTRELAASAGAMIGAAGLRASRRDDIPAAVNLLERATSLLEVPSGELAELLTELGTCLGRAGRLADAVDALERAIAAAQKSGDRRSELRAVIVREQLRSFSAETDPEAYVRVAADAIPELERLGDDLGLAKAWRLASSADAMACRWAARADALERALAYATRVPDAPQERSSLIAVLTQALYYGPSHATIALDRCRAFLAEAEDDPAVRAAVLAHGGGLHAMRGELDEAHRLYDESARLHEELGLSFRRAVLSLVGSEIASLEGDLERAVAVLEDGIQTLEAIGARGERAALVAVRADLLCSAGRDDEAERAAELLADLAEDDDVLVHTLRRSVTSRLLARRGDVPAALALAREADEHAGATDFPTLQATVLVGAAEVSGLAGDAAGARDSLERARGVLDAKGNRVAAGRVEKMSALAP
jgi:class 3 adenylate cyclase/tetratricopeptide (TPR) repeat protein